MTAGMQRLATPLLVFAALTITPLAAWAQIGGLTGGTGTGTGTGTQATAFSPNVEVLLDGEKLDNVAEVYIGTSRCAAGVEYEFRLTGYNQPAPINNLEIWASTTANCSSASSRTRTTTATPSCWLVGEAKSVAGEVTIGEIDALSIFKENADDESGDCPDLSGNKFTVYFVPLANPTSSAPAAPPEPIDGIAVRTAVFTLYTVTPATPGNVRGYNGESRFEVKWDKASGATDRSEYRVLFDTSVGSDSTCSESLLVPEAPPPEADGETLLESKPTRGTSATLTSLGSKNVPIGNFVAAAVIHRDRAGNDSLVSDVMCIERVQTDGFLDVCNRDPECKDGFDSCSVSLGSRGRSVMSLLMLLATIAALLRRRVR